MDNTWNFKIELQDDKAFEKLAQFYGADIPEELKDFIVEANASNPDKNLIDINGVERVFETVLSFNEGEEEATSVFDLIGDKASESIIPFGIDPFGNLFYYSLTTNKIFFYNHEEDEYEDTNYSLSDFLSGLHK